MRLIPGDLLHFIEYKETYTIRKLEEGLALISSQAGHISPIRLSISYIHDLIGKGGLVHVSRTTLGKALYG